MKVGILARAARAAALLLVAGLAASAPSPAEAQGRVVYVEPAPQQRVVYVRPIVRQPYTHTGGFFGRLQLGAAYSYSSYSDQDLDWGGGAIEGALSLGFSLPIRLALHVDFLGSGVWEPTVYVDGTDLGYLDDTSYSTGGIGPGFTYYFPRNGFITGGLGFAAASLVSDYYEADSDVGGYLTFGGGMEWWVAPRFGIGVYGRLTGYALPDAGVDAAFTTVVPAIGLSMTFD